MFVNFAPVEFEFEFAPSSYVILFNSSLCPEKICCGKIKLGDKCYLLASSTDNKHMHRGNLSKEIRTYRNEISLLSE